MGEQEEIKKTTEAGGRVSEESGGSDNLKEPKISPVVGYIAIAYAALLDIVGIIIVFIALDDVMILDILGAPLNFYFYYIGVNATRSTVTSLLELIPYVGALPLKTIGVIMTVYIDKHPESKIAQAANKVGQAKGASDADVSGAAPSRKIGQPAAGTASEAQAQAGSGGKIKKPENGEASGSKKFGSGSVQEEAAENGGGEEEGDSGSSPSSSGKGKSQSAQNGRAGVGEQYGVGSESGEAKKFIPEEAKGAGTEDNELLEKVAENAAEDSPYAAPESENPYADDTEEQGLILPSSGAGLISRSSAGSERKRSRPTARPATNIKPKQLSS